MIFRKREPGLRRRHGKFDAGGLEARHRGAITRFIVGSGGVQGGIGIGER